MSKYKGLFTFDVDSHRYLPIALADGTIDCMGYHPEPAPLITDEKIRKAVRAWAELNKSKQVVYVEYTASTDYCCLADMDNGCYCIKFVGRISALKDGEEYTIDEICGGKEEK